MIRKIIFCLILLCCISPIAFAETISDNINETIDNDTLINNTDDSNLEISNTPYNVRITDDGRIRLDFNFSERFNELKRVSTGGDKYNLTEIYSELAKLHPKPVIDYTDTYTMDTMTGKFVPLGNVTKPLPPNMVIQIEDTCMIKSSIHNGWGLTYDDIIHGNHNEHSLADKYS